MLIYRTVSMCKILAGWCFQPIWKIWVKMGNLPQIPVKIENIWNHHLAGVPTLPFFGQTVPFKPPTSPKVSTMTVIDVVESGIAKTVENSARAEPLMAWKDPRGRQLPGVPRYVTNGKNTTITLRSK